MPPSSIPPGVLHLLQTVPNLLFPLVFVYGLQRSSTLILPTYAWALTYVSAIPVIFLTKHILEYIKEESEIRRLGARRVPIIPRRWPGGIDVMIRAIESNTTGKFDDLWKEETERLGSYIVDVHLLGDAFLFTAEPDHIKAMLATEFDNFEKGTYFQWYMHSVLGTGVFNSDGNMWKFHRGITRPYFARERISDFETFNHHADLAIKKMKERFAEGEALDFQDVAARFTLDSATEFLFGSCVESLSSALPYSWNSSRHQAKAKPHSSDKFAVAFGHAQDQVAHRSRLASMWPLFEFWKDKTKDDMKIIHDYIEPIIKGALVKKASKNDMDSLEKNNELATTLLDHLVQQTDDVGVIRDETFNILIAGRDTTMSTLTFAIYLLSENPNVLAKLREEILTIVGEVRPPTIEDVKQCKYLRAVINETLRLFPPVPFNLRHSIRSTTWRARDGGKPHYIPADVDVGYSVFMMHRRTDLWGPDALQFDPDRFLDERVHKYLTPNPMIFLPFNAGKFL
ncbi:hypothetical protein M422DRAFT_234321 [Sphaerobolus stellatus SS14]|uniref:Uncharacterized protein n=1 Tax=Sphaerobolus stellatus (strain SS14) TaxID=990650 RepID=A0A0C9V3E5_SPHS4|nr:hypothetical protein M422DRAFT_234321 [Sphaerobolus stellatus SS14]